MPDQNRFIPNLLSIAGSDPSGGAGIQADLKTFAALSCHGMAAITALTAQNTRGVGSIHLLPAAFVAEQIAMIFADIEVAAVKIGMMGSAAIVEAAADALAPHLNVRGSKLPIVVDPVLVSTSGAALGDDAVIDALWRRLFPIATLVTPNLAEASRLAASGPLSDRASIEAAAVRLHAAAPVAWLVKGGHANNANTADDLLLDAQSMHWLSAPRIGTRNTHGTGCTLSSACASLLAKGRDVRQAVEEAKTYLNNALASNSLAVGQGHGPVDHFARFREHG